MEVKNKQTFGIDISFASIRNVSIIIIPHSSYKEFRNVLVKNNNLEMTFPFLFVFLNSTQV